MSAGHPQLHQGPRWFPDLASQPLTPHPGVAGVVGTHTIIAPPSLERTQILCSIFFQFYSVAALSDLA